MKAILIFTTFTLCFIQCESKIDSVNNNLPNQNKVVEKAISPTPKVLDTPVEKKDKKMDKETLAKRVEPVDADVSRMIIDQKSQIKTVDTPFLKEGNIYLVSKFVPTRRIEIYIGVVGADFTQLIGGDEEKFYKFIQKAGLVLTNSELRLEYILNYLEITKSGGKRFQIVESVDEIKERPNLTDEQKQKFAEFQNKYRSIIQPPKQSSMDAFRIFVIKDQDLVEYVITITEDNKIEKKETVLEKDLLIPYAL